MILQCHRSMFTFIAHFVLPYPVALILACLAVSLFPVYFNLNRLRLNPLQFSFMRQPYARHLLASSLPQGNTYMM